MTSPNHKDRLTTKRYVSCFRLSLPRRLWESFMMGIAFIRGGYAGMYTLARKWGYIR